MTDETDSAPEQTLFPKPAGERLRDARVAQRLDLADIAQRTRVPLRHLQALEDGDYAQLPGPTYAVGFAKSYARAVGEDEVEIAREVRGRADASAARKPEFTPYVTDEPARTPPGGVMLAGIVLAVLIAVAAGLWYGTTLFRGDGLDGGTPAPTSTFSPEVAPAPTVAPAAVAQVTLVASDEVWVRVYDAAGTTLLQRTLAPGERYDVPPTADNPMINVGRADKLQVLVNGSAVPPLGDGRVAIKDVPIGAAALQARGTAAAAVAPSAGVTGSSSPDRARPAAFRDRAPASSGQRDAPLAAAVAPGSTPDNTMTPR